MRRFYPYALVLGVFFATRIFDTPPEYEKGWLALAIGLGLVGLLSKPLIDKNPRVLSFFYAAGAAAAFGMFPKVLKSPVSTLGLQWSAGLALVLFILFFRIPAPILARIRRIYIQLAPLFILDILIQAVRRVADDHTLLLGNPSLQGCLIAALLPFIEAWYIFWPGVLAVALTLASMPLAALVPVIWFRFPKIKARYKLGTLLAGFVTCAYIYPEYLTPRGRFNVWREAYGWWVSEPSRLLYGAGLGTSQILVPYIQASNGMPLTQRTFFFSFHNDYAQTVFEWGVPLAICAGLLLLHRVRVTTGARRVACYSFMISMFGNYMLHHPFTLIFGFALLWSSL